MNSRFALDREPFSATITHVLGFHFTISFEKTSKLEGILLDQTAPPPYIRYGRYLPLGHFIVWMLYHSRSSISKLKWSKFWGCIQK